ncbi:hypothetical protein PtB15_2B510 [Puccinia triticina]|nr:hypothetical protein PtB15_2B510 [Puccinia triticina]
MYDKQDPEGGLQVLYGKWLTVSISFVEYVQTQWAPNIVHWAMAYRSVAEGIKRQRTNKFQDMAKAKADKYTPAIMQLLGIEVRQTPTHFCIFLFTSPATKAYMVQYILRDEDELGRIRSCTCEYFASPPPQPRMNLDDWAPDGSFRWELPPNGPGNTAPTGGQTTERSKKRRINEPQSLRDGPEPSAEDTEVDKPLMNDEDFALFLQSLAKKPICPVIPTPVPSSGPLLNPDEVLRHLTNLSASALDALQQTIDLLKFIENRRMIAKKTSPEWMWTFRRASESIRQSVVVRCPKAPKSREVNMPGISVVQSLPREEVDIIINRLQQAGFNALKAARGFITHKDHKADFLANSEVTEMESLRGKEAAKMNGQ